jgi:hypothetical protein
MSFFERRGTMPQDFHNDRVSVNESETDEQENQSMTGPASETAQKLGRRRLLKVLAATGGAVAASTLLPGEWIRPVVEVGELPVHAQISPTPTATPTPTPTATPLPIYAIVGCFFQNAAGGGNIGPTDTIEMYAQILPSTAGIELRRSVILNQAGHPQNGDVGVATAFTDGAGICTAPDFDLSGLSPPILPGVGRITISWEFVDPADGTNSCQNVIEVIP